MEAGRRGWEWESIRGLVVMGGDGVACRGL